MIAFPRVNGPAAHEDFLNFDHSKYLDFLSGDIQCSVDLFFRDGDLRYSRLRDCMSAVALASDDMCSCYAFWTAGCCAHWITKRIKSGKVTHPPPLF